MTKEEAHELLVKDWKKGYTVKVLEVIVKKACRATIIFYKVTCIRDGMTEYRCKGWGNAGGGWDYVTRRKW